MITLHPIRVYTSLVNIKFRIHVCRNGHGARSFLYVSATLWNDLCDDCLTEIGSVAVFKGRLKTHRFNSYLSLASQPHFSSFCHCIYNYIMLLFLSINSETNASEFLENL